MPKFEVHALCPTAVELRLLALEHLVVALLAKVVAVVGKPLLKCRWHRTEAQPETLYASL